MKYLYHIYRIGQKELMYVGITKNPMQRFNGHKKRFRDTGLSMRVMGCFDTNNAALNAENESIINDKPLLNKQLNSGCDVMVNKKFKAYMALCDAMGDVSVLSVRKKIGLNQSEMANEMGMYQPGISRIESGGRKETKQQVVHLRALLALHKAGLI